MSAPGTVPVKERKSRSLVKAISWRLVALVVLGTVSYAFTGSWEETTLITAVYSVLQIFIYFLHERIWSVIHWGKPDALDQLPAADEITPARQNHHVPQNVCPGMAAKTLRHPAIRSELLPLAVQITRLPRPVFVLLGVIVHKVLVERIP